VSGRIEDALEAHCALKRRRTPQPVDVANRIRDLDPALGAHLLLDQAHRKQHAQKVRRDRLARSRMQHRLGRHRQICVDVVQSLGELALVEQKLVLRRHGPSSGPDSPRYVKSTSVRFAGAPMTSSCCVAPRS
jgi:hypothetical protein